MLEINFLPDSDLDDVAEGIKEYEAIWKADGQKIINALENVTGYAFKETFINAIVYGGKETSDKETLKNRSRNDEVQLKLR